MNDPIEEGNFCAPQQPDYSHLEMVDIGASSEVADYQAAMQQANNIAEEKLED